MGVKHIQAALLTLVEGIKLDDSQLVPVSQPQPDPVVVTEILHLLLGFLRLLAILQPRKIPDLIDFKTGDYI